MQTFWLKHTLGSDLSIVYGWALVKGFKRICTFLKRCLSSKVVTRLFVAFKEALPSRLSFFVSFNSRVWFQVTWSTAHLRVSCCCLPWQHELLPHHYKWLSFFKLFGDDHVWLLLKRWLELFWLHYREGWCTYWSTTHSFMVPFRCLPSLDVQILKWTLHEVGRIVATLNCLAVVGNWIVLSMTLCFHWNRHFLWSTTAIFGCCDAMKGCLHVSWISH